MTVLEKILEHWQTVALASIPLVGFLVFQWYRSRKINFDEFAHFPQPEKPDPKHGHWPWIEKSIADGDSRRSFDLVLFDQAKKLGNPPVLLCDLRPREPCTLLFINDHSVAEQITRASKQFSTSLPKNPSMQNLAPLVGKRSLVTLDGDEWKGLRKRIIPGFQPAHLLSLTQLMVEKSQRFIDHLENYAKSGEDFGMDLLTTNLAFDIIGIVTFNIDLHAQTEGKQSPVLTGYRELQQAFVKPRDFSKHWLLRYFTAVEREIRRLDNKLDKILKRVIVEEHAKLMSGTSDASRSVMALSLQGIDKLTPEILQQSSDTCRGFLFAGHDTTSITMQWTFYELHKRPAALKALKDELDEVFGPDPNPSSVIEQLLSPNNGKLQGRLKYTDAVCKEILRLHPPGTTARMVPKGTNHHLTLPDGTQLMVDGLIMTPQAMVIQRDRNVYGETADDFMPERWLSPEAANFPEGAWRPYERGPRRCTGSELANMEVRIVLALVARRFDFIKVGVGELELDEQGQPILDDKGFAKTKSLLFTSSQVTAKPVDGTRMKVQISEKAKSWSK